MRYFAYSEFDQKGLQGSGQQYMDKVFLQHLDELRHKCGFPFFITSGYRSPEYNASISSTGLTGAHTTGKAVDISVAWDKAFSVVQNAMVMGCFTGVGVQQKGGGRFIHLDILNAPEAPRPAIWSY